MEKSQKFYRDNINISSEIKDLPRDYLMDENRAFFNALWFFFIDFYTKINPP